MTEELKDEDLKLREEADGSVVVGDEPKAEESPADDEGDERVATNESHEGEEQAAEGETDEERAARTERNRARRKAAKEHRKEHIESLKRELAARDKLINEMNQRIAVVERKSTGSEMAQLEAAEKEAIHYYNQFKQINAQAIEKADGATAIDAQEKMFAARQRLEQIANIKKAMNQRQAPQPQPLDPRMAAKAENWIERNSWYDPSGNDDDSALVLAIDQRLTAQGWDPTTEEYWDELDARVKKHLPHRSNQGYNSRKDSARPRGVPVAGSGKESSGGTSGGGYRLSADRVQALKEAGLWDDPKSRAEAIKRFQQFDKEQRA